MKYIVSIPEMHYLNIEVEAETIEKAIEKAQDKYSGDISDCDLDYSHTINETNHWKIEEVK